MMESYYGEEVQKRKSNMVTILYNVHTIGVSLQILFILSSFRKLEI